MPAARSDLVSFDPATIVRRTSVGHVVTHVRFVSVDVVPFAQYPSALRMKWQEGRRKPVGTTWTDAHDIVILRGHVDVAPGGLHGKVAGTSVAYDPAQGDEMDAAIKASGGEILRDYRDHTPHTRLDRATTIE